MTETSLVSEFNKFFDDSKFEDLINSGNNLVENLHIRRTKLISNLKDSISGVLIPEKIRCGKKSCKCNSGYLHGPYYYHYFWRNKKLRKKYVCPVNKPNSRLDELNIKIKNNKKNKKVQREINQIDDTLIRIYKIKETFVSKISKILGGI